MKPKPKLKPKDLPLDPDHYAHGTRARYTMKCRCPLCRAANTAYYHTLKQRGELIDAGPVRAYLEQLPLGVRTIEAAAGIGVNVIRDLLSGKKTRVRQQVADQLLAVGLKDAADHTVIDAATTQRTVAKILGYGYTRAEVSERLGNENHALQLGRRRVLARTERAVLELLATVQQERKQDRRAVDVCLDCGFSHDKETRQRVLARVLPLRFPEVNNLFPCLYENTETGYTRYWRDCKDLGQWAYPRSGGPRVAVAA